MSLLRIPPELHLQISDNLGWNDLYSLIKSHTHLAATLLPRLLPVAARQDGQALILWAATYGNEDLLQQLLETYNIPVKMIAPKIEDAISNPAIASWGNHEIVKYVLQNAVFNRSRWTFGAPCETGSWTDPCPVTPLEVAAYNGHGGCVRVLLTTGAKSIPTLTRNRPVLFTPLDLAARNGHWDVVRMMVSELGVKDCAWSSALMWTMVPTWNEEMVDFMLRYAKSQPNHAMHSFYTDGLLNIYQVEDVERKLVRKVNKVNGWGGGRYR